MDKKCYASRLGNCEGGLSLEHYISSCMLPENVKFLGGVKFANKLIGKKGAGAKILCRHHNSCLHDFDYEACQLLNVMNNRNPNIVIDGNKIEKWLIKTTINHLFQNDSPDYIDQAEAFLDYLFNGKNFAKPNGLYGFNLGYIIEDQLKGFALIPLYGISELCTGVIFFINNFPFVLLNNFHHGPVFTNNSDDWAKESFKKHIYELVNLINGNEIIYRPEFLDICPTGLPTKNICSIKFNWDNQSI